MPTKPPISVVCASLSLLLPLAGCSHQNSAHPTGPETLLRYSDRAETVCYRLTTVAKPDAEKNAPTTEERGVILLSLTTRPRNDHARLIEVRVKGYKLQTTGGEMNLYFDSQAPSFVMGSSEPEIAKAIVAAMETPLIAKVTPTGEIISVERNAAGTEPSEIAKHPVVHDIIERAVGVETLRSILATGFVQLPPGQSAPGSTWSTASPLATANGKFKRSAHWTLVRQQATDGASIAHISGATSTTGRSEKKTPEGAKIAIEMKESRGAAEAAFDIEGGRMISMDSKDDYQGVESFTTPRNAEPSLRTTSRNFRVHVQTSVRLVPENAPLDPDHIVERAK